MQPFRAAPGVAEARASYGVVGTAAQRRIAALGGQHLQRRIVEAAFPFATAHPPAPRQHIHATGRGPTACARTEPRRAGRAAWLCPPSPRRENRRETAPGRRSECSHTKPRRAVSTVPARDGPTRSTALARCRLRASSMTDSRSKRPSAAAARVAPMHHFLDGRLRRCRSYSYLAPTTTRLLPSASPVHDLLSKSVHPRRKNQRWSGNRRAFERRHALLGCGPLLRDREPSHWSRNTI